MEQPKVTIGIPAYNSLENLGGAIASAAAQDHPNLEILVSDNGGLGERLDVLVARATDREVRVRRNETTVPMPEHFNQLLEAASGEYFVLLSDDDELSPDYASRLCRVLEERPDVGVALSRLEVMDEEGEVRSRPNVDTPPPRFMDTPDFVRMWCENSYGFVCFVTNMVRTEEARRVGGYPRFTRGNWIDNGLVVKLSVGRRVAFVPEAEFRYRVYEESSGLSVSYEELTEAAEQFIGFLESHPVLVDYGERAPETWDRMRGLLTEMAWKTCFNRWKGMYRERLPTGKWLRSAFAMPFIPGYYGSVLRLLAPSWLSRLRRAGRRARSGRGAARVSG